MSGSAGERRNQTQRRGALAEALARGDLLPDDLVVDTVRRAAAETDGGGYILDGFPRTVAQAEHPQAPPVDVVVYLAVPDDVVRERLARRAPEGRPDDADPETVEHRLHEYHAATEPLLSYFRHAGRLVTVDGAQPADVVTGAIERAVEHQFGAPPDG